MKKIKVMHVLNTGKYSGAENVAITIINTTKTEVNSIYVSLDGAIEEYLADNHIRYFPIHKLGFFEIRKVINLFRPDIIHAHDYTAGIICAIGAGRIPIINHIHNNSPWIKHYNFGSFIYAISCLRYKKILAVSGSVMDEYVFGRFFEKKTEVVGNPIDISKIRKIGGRKEHIRYDIAFLGRFVPEKNPHMFVDIVKYVKIKFPQISAVMIGDGELYREIRMRIINEELSDNIKMVGFQKNPYCILNSTKLLCMPSVWEGYGLAAVEAMALGLPVVCSKVGGLTKIVDSKCGKLCTDSTEYVEEIIKLLSDAKYYEEKSARAKAEANALSNIGSFTANVIKMYKECMEGK